MAEELVTTMQFQDDIANAEAPPVLPEKEYRMQVSQARFDTLPNGATFLMADFVVPVAEYPADFAGIEDHPDGYLARRQLICEVRDEEGRQTKRHAWNMKKAYKAVGIKPPKDGTVDLKAFDGRELLGKLSYRDVNGEQFPKVSGLRTTEE